MKKHIDASGIADADQRNHWIHDLSLGLRDMHQLYFIHRDIKPGAVPKARLLSLSTIEVPFLHSYPPGAENILISQGQHSKKVAKFIDFGLAVEVVHDPTVREHKRAGTETYMAPEVHAREDYTFSADMWSLAVTFAEVSE